MSPTTLCTQCTQALDADGTCPACSHRAPPPANLAAKAEALFVSYLAARIVHARQRLKLAQRELANDPRNRARADAVARAEDEVTRLQTQLLAQTREAQRVQRAAEQAQFLTRAADAAALDVTPNASDRKCPRCGNAMPGAVNSCRCGYTVETSTANTVSLFAHEPGIAHGKPSKSK